LVEHCATIGLRPTLITNGQILARQENVARFKEDGVFDFLCSVHALEETYNEVTCARKGWQDLLQCIRNLNELDIPWRANCTMIAQNIAQLPRIARFVHENQGRVLNLISFNPFYEWERLQATGFQARHSEIAPHLKEALGYCDRVGLEANVRYFPFCLMVGHEDKCYNFQQLSYDSHEWNFQTWSFAERAFEHRLRSDTRRWIQANGMSILRHVVQKEKFNRFWAALIARKLYRRGRPCKRCGIRTLCDGFTKQYARRFGYSEAIPYAKKITDPTFFISRQHKIVD
jgi:MoaA/NifB/PqqE/SkfB family radical SAM enzyme